VNVWLWAATGLLVALVPAGASCRRGGPVDRAAALQVAGAVTTLELLLLAEGFDRPPYTDLALVLAFLTFVSSLAFARFLERWL
jgi:multisubunit Na+/H+ antiporter MnhF subunit